MLVSGHVFTHMSHQSTEAAAMGKYLQKQLRAAQPRSMKIHKGWCYHQGEMCHRMFMLC